MSGEKTELSVVVPVLNEEGNITPLLDELDAAMGSLEVSYEYVFLNDGSTDKTLERLRQAMQNRPWLRVLSHGTPCGKSEALRTAARAAGGRIIVTIDGDLQNDPADIPRLFNAFIAAEKRGETPGLLAGQREKRIDPFPRNLVSKIANRVRAAILNDGTRDTGCGFKLIRRDVFLMLPFFSGMHRFLPALVKREGYDILHEPVSHRARFSGEAKYNTWNRLWVGIGDMGAVWWMLRRYRAPREYVVHTRDGKDEPCSVL